VKLAKIRTDEIYGW